jgi:hypothetical protein
MNKLDKYFENWKPKTKVVIVGSSPSLCWYKFGKYIDMFDVVVRINECFSKSTYEYTGKKIDVWATTSNDRWDNFNPINESTKEVWPRLPVGESQLTKNGTLSDFTGEVVNMRTHAKKCVFGSNTFKDFREGLGTGLITLNYAIHKYEETITVIGHTFYLESEKEVALNFVNPEEDEEHQINREKFFHKNEFGSKSLQFIIDWMKDEKIVLLNPYEYDNLRVKIK